MTCGFLIHAYNNCEIDYGSMAVCCALLIKKHLTVNSTALVTVQDTYTHMVNMHSEELIHHAFDHIILTDISRNVADRTFFDTRYNRKAAPYYNTNRSDTLALSPFDETILIDADYLVLDNSLDKVWGSVEDIMVNKSVIDLNHVQNLGGFDKRIGLLGIELYWATVVYFKKTALVDSLFGMVQYIKDNYQYYSKLYNFPSSSYFRNDYALSVALHMINAHTEMKHVSSLPIQQLMVSTENDDLIDFVNGNAFFISERSQGDFRLHKVNTNVHVMNKWSIGRVASRIISYASC
jgi:hypothetical protein